MLISKIPASSFVSLRLSPFLCLPACWFPKSPPLVVSFHLSPCMLIPKISLLHLSPFICLPACWCPISLHADYRNRCRSRGSYFSKVGLLITEIAAAPSLPLHADYTEIAAAPASSFVSLHLSPCMLISKITASSFVSLHLSPCMLIPNLPACWLPKSLPLLVSLLHLSPFICLRACWLPKSLPLLASLIHLSPFIPQIAGSYRGSYFSMTGWSPKSPNGLDAAAGLSPFICLPSWFSFWAALGCPCRLISQACLRPSWSPCWAALSCRCRLVSQACLSSKSHMLSSFLGLMFLALWVGRCYLWSMPV